MTRTDASQDRPAVGIVHLGPGAFFRAHGMIYLEQAMAASGGDWGVLGVSLRSGDTRDRLAGQDFIYHALERGPDAPVARRVTALRGVLVAAEDPRAVVAAMADPAISLVTLTVTEKGYCHAPSTGTLNPDHPGIRHDLTHPDTPKTAPGFIVAALAARRAAGVASFTCLSCDNLPDNGSLLRRVVLKLAEQQDPALAAWIRENALFPCSMVDRIVPATTDADIAEVARLTGMSDAAPVVHEPFRQWVIEDAFVTDSRPDLEAVGACLVADVAPYERMKLRCLNGTHSALAWLGLLAGKPTIFDAVADDALRHFIEALWLHEITPGLAPPPGIQPLHYAADLMARYRNPNISHRSSQIAADGSQKLPQRILMTISENLAAGLPIRRLCLVVAAWIRFLGGKDDGGAAIDIRDPLAERLVAAARGPDPVGAVLDIEQVFAPDLAQDMRFRDAVRDGFRQLSDKGVIGTLTGWIDD